MAKYLLFLKDWEKTGELQKVNPNELVIFSMVWREITKIMRAFLSKIDRVSKKYTDRIHNKGRDVTLKMSLIKIN